MARAADGSGELPSCEPPVAPPGPRSLPADGLGDHVEGDACAPEIRLLAKLAGGQLLGIEYLEQLKSRVAHERRRLIRRERLDTRLPRRASEPSQL